MSEFINIVEPTLTNEAGHCFSLINNLVKTEGVAQFSIWANAKASINFEAYSRVSLSKYFHRRIRKIQCFLLYKRLLKTKNKIFISTAGMLDLALFAFIAKEVLPPKQVYFYFHWINNEEDKLARLKKIAQKQPNLMILGTTKSVVDVFKKAGFSHAKVAPYPISIPEQNTPLKLINFSKVLVAGAARQDKGFSNVVDLVDYLATIKAEIPFYIQSSSEHLNKSEAKTQLDIARLKRIEYQKLTICEKTLSEIDYLNLFPGSICLQPYDAKAFSDRVSGVTLDSLMAGSPVVTTANTWIAKCIQRFDAGIVLNSNTPNEIAAALNTIIRDYDFYAKNAKNASLTLQSENDASQLLSAILN